MQRLELSVDTAVGLHARPAANLVKLAMGFQAAIFVEKEGRRVNARSLLAILSLAVKAGDRVTVLADGVDEREALAAISQLAMDHFGEPEMKGG